MKQQDDLGDLWEGTTHTSTPLPSEFRCECHPAHQGHSFGEDLNCDYCKVAWLDFLANPGICECFMNKPLNRGGYQVQWNKHEKNWSVRHKGKVVDRVSQGVLLKATFKHPKSGRSRARRPAIYCKKSDWFPDMGSVGDYKTTLPVRYHHGLSKWQVHFSSTEVKPVLKYEVVFITPSGDININPTLGYEGFHRILREDEWKNPQ